MARRLANAQTYSHYLLKSCIQQDDTVVDATMGNGHDTLFLAQCVGKNGQVFAFDIQARALANTRARLEEHNVIEQCSLYLLGHQYIDTVLPIHTKISGAIFNLGYLPGSNKQIVTTGEQTISAIEQLLPRLKQSGLIILVVYSGHIGGQEEADELQQFVSTLSQKNYAILNYRFINQKNSPPQLIVIEKL